MKDEFFIVIDANVMKDYIESPLECYEDDVHKAHVLNAAKLFKRLQANVKICLDGNKDSSKILYEYKKQIGKKNKILYEQYIIQLSQDRLRFIPSHKLSKLTYAEKKDILQKQFDRDDLIYLDVAKSIMNKRFIITRVRTFYDPRNPKKIGCYDSVMMRHIRKELKIFVRIAKDSLKEKEICS